MDGDGPAPPLDAAAAGAAADAHPADPVALDEGLSNLCASSDVTGELCQALSNAGLSKVSDLSLFISEGGTPVSWGSALLALIRTIPANGGLPDSLAHKVRLA